MVFDPLGAYKMLETRTISPSPIMNMEEAFLYPEEYAEILSEQRSQAAEIGESDDSNQEDCE